MPSTEERARHQDPRQGGTDTLETAARVRARARNPAAVAKEAKERKARRAARAAALAGAAGAVTRAQPEPPELPPPEPPPPVVPPADSPMGKLAREPGAHAAGRKAGR
jgi:hypothetical protein